MILFLSGLVSLLKMVLKLNLKKETINYGTVTKGEDNGNPFFEFKNTGNEPLIIKDAKSSCGLYNSLAFLKSYSSWWI